MLPAFISYDDDLSVCYRNALQFSALRGCLESKNINIGFICKAVPQICSNFTLMRDGSQKLTDWGNIKTSGLPYLIGQYCYFQSSSLRSSYTGTIVSPAAGKTFGSPHSGCCPTPPAVQAPYPRNLFLLTRYLSLKSGGPWKGSFCPFWHDLAGPCTHKIGFVSGCLSADGVKFCCSRSRV